MGCLGNIIWFFFGGALGAIGWFLAGCLWCISIIGIPIGLQCFKFATLSLFPFGKEVTYGGGVVSLLMNVIWLLISGIPLAIHHLFWGVVFCITIIGFPFGMQHFKLAKLALMPFGAEVY
ncbi:MAG TPA: YccF domain-containing protein [Lachnospiraceae bacterium]|nr:YccF domain-containing protein [Lachnospiraceae bacterium]